MEETREIDENAIEVINETSLRYESQKTQKNWCGTWNNPDLADEQFCEYLKMLLGDDIQYFIFQREIAPTTGTHHIQWFVIFANRKNFNTVKSIMPRGSHIEPCKGNAVENRTYCSKRDTQYSSPYEGGEFVQERQRTDMNNIIALAKSGASDTELLELYPSQTFMYQKRIQELRRTFKKEEFSKRCRNVEVFFYYGVTGTKKTTRILKQHGLQNCFVVDNYGTFMFDGYEHQQVIILDEYEGQEKMITKLNKILEPNPYKMNIKGGVVWACYDKVYFISNLSFDELYKELRLTRPKIYDAFYRRIHHIIRVDERGNEIKEKESFFEDVPEDEIDLPGLTKRVSHVVTYDSAGRPSKIYSLHKYEQVDMVELTEEELKNMPF